MAQAALWGDDLDRKRQDDPARQLALLNERRKRKRLPPLTAEQAEANLREFQTRLKKGAPRAR